MGEQFGMSSTGSVGFQPPAGRGGSRRPRWVLFIPLCAFVGIGAAFYFLLGRDSHVVVSPLIGKPVPQFSLPPVQGRTLGLSSADLRGEVSMVNVFASWCVACRAEHPVLTQLKAKRVVPIHGLNYKDKPDDAARWLDGMGDPYTRTGADLDGRVGVDWGVYGVPETFVVDREGRIVYKQIGPLTQTALDRTILPLIARLRRANESDHGQTGK
jgi:cytochrome c biogenesis protein CcmG/thiol:disulfide interchange protein DsbE